MSESGTTQIPLDQAAHPQQARAALARREAARDFMSHHENRVDILAGDTRLIGCIDPWTAIHSVWREPLQDDADSRFDWAKRTHHAILSDEHPEWDYCPRCGEVLPA